MPDAPRSLSLLVCLCWPLAARVEAQAPVHTVYGYHDKLGFSVDSVGDIDHDGTADFAAGNWPGFLPQRVRVFSGRSAALIRDMLLPATAGHGVDVIVARGGDTNGDGWLDVLVGDPSNDTNGYGTGAVWVLSGADGSVLHSFLGVAGSSGMGGSIASAGDVDGDGRPDVVAGFGGSFRVWSGATGAVLFTVADGFNRVRAAGDRDADGHADILAASPTTGVGRVRVYSGASAAVLLEVQSGTAGDSFGIAADSAGDIDGDGVPDVVVGAPYADLGGVDSGAVFWFSGSSGALLRMLPGMPGRKLGRLIARMGDADGDGIDDVAAVDALGTGPQASTVYVFSGATGASIYSVRARYPAIFGEVAIGAAGDLNGDGRADLLVGDPLAHDPASSTSDDTSGSVTAYLAGCASPEVYCTAKVNSLGCTPAIAFENAPSLSIGSGFVVRAFNVLAHANGLLFFGPTASSAPFGGGTLCVGGPAIRRTPIQNAGGTPGIVDCTGQYAYTFSHAVMSAFGFAPGQRWYAQYYSRDGGFPPPNNIGLTDAVAFTVCP